MKTVYDSLNPKPQQGSGAYGAVPGVLSLPQNLYSQVNKQFPGFQQTGQGAADFIGSEVKGQLSPETMDMLQNKGAQFGVQAGVPMGGPGSFASNNYLKNLGLTTEQLQRTGTQDYLGFLGQTGATMNDPKLAYEVQLQNALDSAAPNPGQAASAMQAAAKSGYNFANAPFSMPSGGGGGAPSMSTADRLAAFSPSASGTMVGYGPGHGTPDAAPYTAANWWSDYGGKTPMGGSGSNSSMVDMEDYGGGLGYGGEHGVSYEQDPSAQLDDYYESINQE